MNSLEKIIEVIGEPYYKNDFVLLYNMDSEFGLKKLIDSNISIDCTITSPPYNIGKDYEKVLPLNEYIDWLHSINELIYMLTNENGAYLLNVGYLSIENVSRAIPIPYLIWNKMKFFLNQEIVWNYGAGVASKRYLSPRNEKILWYIKNKDNYTFNLDDIRDPDVKYPNQKKKGKLRCNTIGKNPSDVWHIAKVTSGENRSSSERTEHPAQFPEDLIRKLILGFSNPNDLILDPFIGSGTTAIVAMNTKRYCIGFEINSNYCDLATKRIKKIEAIALQEEMVLSYLPDNLENIVFNL